MTVTKKFMPARISAATAGAKRAFPIPSSSTGREFRLGPAFPQTAGAGHHHHTPLGAARNFCSGRAMKLAALLFLLLPVGLCAEDEGFVPLFDGQTLDGWVNVNCQPATWTVRDGMIHCDGQPTGALRTPRQYENFILELEWRHLKPAGNAGIFIWASPQAAPGVPFLRSIEVQVLDHGYGNTGDYTTHGDVFAIHGDSMKPFPPSKGMRSFPTERRSRPAPEWNHYRITCQDGTIRLAVNGKEVSGGSECGWRKGYIGLESEGSPVDWRNLRIKELPASGATPAQSAPVEEHLYDGRTLRGWKEVAGWKAGDWRLKAEAGAAPLRSEKALADFELHLDWSWDADPSTTVPPLILRGGDAEEIRLPELPAVKAKDWNRLSATRRGTRLTLTLNGAPAGEIEVPAGKLTPVLHPAGNAIGYAHIFLK